MGAALERRRRFSLRGRGRLNAVHHTCSGAFRAAPPGSRDWRLPPPRAVRPRRRPPASRPGRGRWAGNAAQRSSGCLRRAHPLTSAVQQLLVAANMVSTHAIAVRWDAGVCLPVLLVVNLQRVVLTGQTLSTALLRAWRSGDRVRWVLGVGVGVEGFQGPTSCSQDDTICLGGAHNVWPVLDQQRRAPPEHLPQQHRRLVQVRAACATYPSGHDCRVIVRVMRAP